MKLTPTALRVAAIHDLCGLGRVSLTAVIPVLTTMGFEVCPLPTAILSNHTMYPSCSFMDLTDEMPKIIEKWRTFEVTFDAIYSGYLGSPKQIDIVRGFIADFRTPDTLVVVDPVVGDNGKLYRKITQEMVDGMRELVAHADVATPNLTEAYALLGRPYCPNAGTQALKQMIDDLIALGPDTVIITGAPVENNPKLTSVIAKSRSDGRFWQVSCPYLPAHFPGTGDVFTSVITGSLLQGDSLPIALDRAAQFILQGIRATFGYKGSTQEGILLERVLPNLQMPIVSSTYELV